MVYAKSVMQDMVRMVYECKWIGKWEWECVGLIIQDYRVELVETKLYMSVTHNVKEWKSVYVS